MSTIPAYIGGAFAQGDSESFRLEKPANTNWFLPEGSDLKTSGFETGADAIAWLLEKVLENETTSNVYFPLHYCQETLDRIQLKIPAIQVLRYVSAQDINEEGIVIWNHFNGHCPIPDGLLASHKILEDCVQSLESMRLLKGMAGFTSLRKWMELDLAVVISPFEPALFPSSPSDYFMQKKEAERVKHDWKLNGDAALEEDFLQLFSSAEHALSTSEIFAADTEEMVHYDWSRLIEKRRSNAQILLSAFREMNIAIIGESELFVMISIEKRDELRTFLFKHGVFAPVHWLDSEDKPLAGSVLSLPIDQRYSEADMHRIITLIREYFANPVL